jgi:hypothetical protein
MKQILGLVNDSHPAAAQPLEDGVMGKNLARDGFHTSVARTETRVFGEAVLDHDRVLSAAVTGSCPGFIGISSAPPRGANEPKTHTRRPPRGAQPAIDASSPPLHRRL